MIVLDTACPREELQDAKDSIGQLLALLPEECYVRVDYVWSDGDGARVERNESTAEELRAERDERCDARESEEVVRFGIDRSGIRDVR